MRQLITSLLVLGLLTTPAPAQLIDQQLNPGDLFSAEIDSTSDVDVVALQSVAGAGLKVIVSPVAKSGLRPHVQLVDTSDDSVVAEASATKKKVTLTFDNADKGAGLPTTGTYHLRVSGLDDTTGAFTLRFTEKLSKANRKFDETVDVAADGVASVGFDAAAGMEAALTVQRASKASAADPALPDVRDPADVVADLSGAKVKSNKQGDKHTLKGVALDSTGEWSIETTNEGEQGELRIRGKLKRAKTKKRKLGELPLGASAMTSLSGSVLASNDGEGLENVTITVHALPGGTPTVLVGTPPEVIGSTQTDAAGNFLVPALPPGEVEVRVDGTTATGKPAGATFGVLMVMAEVLPEGPSSLPQALVLPDLNNPAAAKQSVAIDVLGQTTEIIDAVSGTGAAIALFGPVGTAILIDGVPASAPVDLNVTPVSPDEVPMPLLDAEGNPLDAASYVTVQPPNARFDTAGVVLVGGLPAGLDVELPNDRGFPPGTLVDIWSFDHDLGAWVNRSTETGQQGVVSPDGTRIAAEDVIVKGGWHAPVLPVDPDCASKLVGRVVDSVTDAPIAGATVATDLGQFATTDANGEFELVSVPAYELPSVPCMPIDVTVRVIGSVDHGHAQTSVVVDSGSLAPGDCTDLGDLPLAVPVTGNLAGRLTLNGAPVSGGTVSVTGTAAFALTSDADGRFFATGLQPGSYLAAHTFPDDAAPTQVAFGITANTLTTINLQKSGGAGSHDLTVCVVKLTEDLSGGLGPISGAQVLLVGSDPSSAGGVIGSTNASGKVTFLGVDPPYTITAQVDRPIFDGGELLLARLATSVIDVTPTTSTLNVPIETDVEGEGNDLFDATLDGHVANIPIPPPGGFLPGYEVEVVDADTGENYGVAFVDPGSGDFSTAIPSGRRLHLVFREVEFEDLPTGLLGGQGFAEQTLVADALLDQQSPGPGETLEVDFDYDQGIPFDRVVPIEVTNMPTTATRFSWAVSLFDADQGIKDLELGRGQRTVYSAEGVEPPASVLFPDVTGTALGDIRTVAVFDAAEDSFAFAEGLPAEFFERGLACDLVLDENPASLDVEFPVDFVSIASPTHFEDLDPAEAQSLVVTYDDQVSAPQRAFCLIFVGSDQLGDDLGVDGTGWLLLVAAGTPSVQFPPTALPMFGEQGSYELGIETLELSGGKLSLESLLGGDFGDNLEALDFGHDGICENFVDIGFTVGGGGGAGGDL